MGWIIIILAVLVGFSILYFQYRTFKRKSNKLDLQRDEILEMNKQLKSIVEKLEKLPNKIKKSL